MPDREIIKIPANRTLADLRRKKRKLRVAAYCRVSTEEEEQQSSFEIQVAYYTNLITNHEGWELTGIFADEGIDVYKRQAVTESLLKSIDGYPPAGTDPHERSQSVYLADHSVDTMYPK